jgi:hypothetical protein
MNKAWAGFVDLPDLEPIVGIETTEYGWKGLTADGEVLQVHGQGVPESIMIYYRGEPTGRRLIDERAIDVSGYLARFESATEYHKANRNAEALDAIEAAITIFPTLRARFNRALVLLALGRWREGFEEFVYCEEHHPFQRPQSRAAIAAGLRPWRGQSLQNKRLLLLHDHGFGDTLMMLRYVPVLKLMGADVVLMMPPELARLAAQFGPVTANSLRVVDADYFVPMLHLLREFAMLPVPTGPYIRVDAPAQHYVGARRRIGVAWSIGKRHDGDYPREIPLIELLPMLDVENCEVHSVQVQGREEAEALGVRTHDFADFSDCAAFMLQMDEIVTVDTAAVHLAGAIGHPCTTILISDWASWRWQGNPFYPAVHMRRFSCQ